MTRATEDHYTTLAIDRDASPSVIKRAYLQLIQIHTPEKDPTQFQRITEAYQTLSNPEKRKAYDAEERLPPALQQRIGEILEEADEDNDEIADNLRELVDEWPSSQKLREMVGHHLMLAERASEAVEMFRDLCDLDPENPRYMTRLGTALLEDGEKEEGVATLKAALVADPHNATGYLRLAMHYLEQEQPKEAVRILERGVDVDGKLDAADLPLLTHLVIIHGRELEWDQLRQVGLKIRRLVPPEDKDARRYVASQLAELIEPYSKAERPDMLHFLFDLMAELDPQNTQAAKFRDQLRRDGDAWREKVDFLRSQTQPDWFGAFVHAVLDEERDTDRKKLLDFVLIHVATHRTEALSRWAQTKQRYPSLAAQLEERWNSMLELARLVGERMRLKDITTSSSTSSSQPATNSGCLMFLVSTALLAASVLLALLI